jgi:hypothetical protein
MLSNVGVKVVVNVVIKLRRKAAAVLVENALVGRVPFGWDKLGNLG